ncbi:MAG: hypothetical protein KZY74_17025, partial [Paenibacillaceae bacterium]|nr:hypothetical protein [Paenibacillaceae bacterium]
MPEARKPQKKLTTTCKILLCACILYSASGAGLPLAGGLGTAGAAGERTGQAALATLRTEAD